MFKNMSKQTAKVENATNDNKLLLAIGAAWGIELLYVHNQRNNIEKEAISQSCVILFTHHDITLITCDQRITTVKQDATLTCGKIQRSPALCRERIELGYRRVIDSDNAAVG